MANVSTTDNVPSFWQLPKLARKKQKQNASALKFATLIGRLPWRLLKATCTHFEMTYGEMCPFTYNPIPFGPRLFLVPRVVRCSSVLFLWICSVSPLFLCLLAAILLQSGTIQKSICRNLPVSKRKPKICELKVEVTMSLFICSQWSWLKLSGQ